MTFDEFVAAHLDRLLRAARAMCGDPGLAEDIVHDVLIKVRDRWTRISTLDQRDAYVQRMLVNEHLSWRRKWSRVSVVADPPEPHAAPDPAQQHVDRDAIEAALRTLPPRQRVVIALRYHLALTDAEIAEAMGCTAGTVRGYASRALVTLRVALAESVDLTGDPHA